MVDSRIINITTVEFLLIRYTCNPGYHFRSGITSLTYGCTDGMMALKPPPCERKLSDISIIYISTTVLCACTQLPVSEHHCNGIGITCDESLSIDNGQVVISGSGLGSTATYTCNEGFILSDGFTRRVCQDNNQWSGRAGVCRRTYLSYLTGFICIV